MNPEITLANYETFLLLRTDDELTPAEDAALDNFLAQHPELQAEAAAYAATRISPDASIVFAGKDSLLRPEAAPAAARRLRLAPWSLAAAAVLLVAVSLWRRGTPDANQLQERPVAKAEAPVRTVLAPATNPEPTLRPALAATPAPVRRASSKPATAIVKTHPVSTPAVLPQPAPQEPALAKLDIVPAAPLADPATRIDRPTEPVTVLVTTQERPAAKGLLQTLPLTKDRLEGLASLKDAAKTQLQRVKEARETLKNTEATFALAGHELFTIRF